MKNILIKIIKSNALLYNLAKYILKRNKPIIKYVNVSHPQIYIYVIKNISDLNLVDRHVRLSKIPKSKVSICVTNIEPLEVNKFYNMDTAYSIIDINYFKKYKKKLCTDGATVIMDLSSDIIDLFAY